MQDRYTGDVGDFGKYGLLRCLRGHDDAALRLGVIWYRTDESIVEVDSANDGEDTGYLHPDKEAEYRPCDSPLYDKLREIVDHGGRRVRAVEQSELLGPEIQFHDDYVPGPAKRAPKYARQTAVDRRRRWVQDARRKTADCDLLFLDPDTGLEIPSEPITRFNAPKYAYLDEVQEFFGRCQSLVIYQHRTHEDIATQLNYRREQLQQRLQPADIFALHFPGRLFFVVATEAHASLLRERANALLASPWSQHFTLLPCANPQDE